MPDIKKTMFLAGDLERALARDGELVGVILDESEGEETV